ncbi:MAG: hypothetical protein IIA02_04290 [Proteobacteria bacterium]|uniref:hypothetical protein n=1 Tax=Aquabacterium sp. TaxID=1872578 RepID=UPI0035C6BEE5|nr:hypothetical protein [Pseudomonadota bacterium]
MPASPRRTVAQPTRRHVLQLASALAAPALTWPTWAAPRLSPRADAPEVGVDPALVASGLTERWSQAMRRDMGWSARWRPLPSGALLLQMEQGEVDLGIYLSHPQASRLAQQGLIHDQHPLARTDVLLVGPAQDLAGIRAERDPALALRQVLVAHAAGAALWQAPPPASALAALLERLLAGAGVQPGASAGPLAGMASAPAARGKPPADIPYRLLTRAEWLAAPPARGQAAPRVWLQGGPDQRLLSLDCTLARPFRAKHPGARLLVQWLQGPLARQAVAASAPGWQPLQG